MTGSPPDDWPPIIAGADRSRWIVCRDIAITVFMWGLFLLLLEKEIEIVSRAHQILTGYSVERIDAGIEALPMRMRSTAGFVLLLVAFLGVSTFASRHRRDRAVLQAPPAAALDWELARDLGFDEQELQDITRQKIVALDVDGQGKVTVLPNWKPPTGSSSH